MARVILCDDCMRKNGIIRLDSAGIENILPHRRKALMPNSIFEYDGRIHGSFLPSMDMFEGHFDRNPILPAMYIQEAGSQAMLCAAVLTLREKEGPVEVRASVMKVKPIKPVIPGQEIFFSLEELGKPKVLHGMNLLSGMISAWAGGLHVANIWTSGSVKFL